VPRTAALSGRWIGIETVRNEKRRSSDYQAGRGPP
jgi:hypothetical protein